MEIKFGTLEFFQVMTLTSQYFFIYLITQGTQFLLIGNNKNMRCFILCAYVCDNGQHDVISRQIIR